MSFRHFQGAASRPTCPQALDFMRRAAPPRSVVHVGAGDGGRASRIWGGPGIQPAAEPGIDTTVEHLLMVEADPARARELSATAATRPGWGAVCALLGENDGAPAPYHVTSNPAANGRIDVDALQALWPNLRRVETQTIPERRLDRLLDCRDWGVLAAPNWVVIDCLPALPILKGAGLFLDGLDVVWARVVLDPGLLGIAGGSLRAVTEFLTANGFRMIDVIEDVHPALGDAFYLRDWRARFEPRVRDLEAACQQLMGRYEEKSELAARLEESIRRHQVDIGQLKEVVAEQARVAAGLGSAPYRLASVSDPGLEPPLTPPVDSPRWSPALPPAVVDMAIEGSYAQMQAHQRRMDEELIRAEAQIDLLKDLLFGDTRP